MTVILPKILFTVVIMPPKDEFTQSELEMVMSVFKQYETGLREACIDVKVRGKECSNYLNTRYD